MANITELNEKVDALQTSLDNEQAQIQAAIEALNQSIADLQAMITDGGTAEERQALAAKLDSIKTDLESTVADNTEGEGDNTGGESGGTEGQPSTNENERTRTTRRG